MAPTEANHTQNPAEPPPRLSTGLSGGLAERIALLGQFTGHVRQDALCGAGSRCGGIADNLVPVVPQGVLETCRGIFCRAFHPADRLGQGFVQGFGFLLVEAGAGQMLDAPTQGNQLLREDVERVSGVPAHAGSAFAAT